MITTAQAAAFFALADNDEALQAYQFAKEILIEREILDSEAAPKRRAYKRTLVVGASLPEALEKAGG